MGEQLKADKAKWPKGVQSITIGALGYLGFDNKGKLYWEGRPAEIRKSFDLKWW